MDNPWATTWEQSDGPEIFKKLAQTPSHTEVQTHDQEEDLGLPSWSTSTSDPTQWPASSHTSDALWTSSIDSGAWRSSTYSDINLSRQGPIGAVVESETQATDIVPTLSIPPAITNDEDNTIPSDAVESSLALPIVEAIPPVPESPDIFGGFEAPGVSAEEEDEGTDDGGEAWADPVIVLTEDSDGWGAAWTETSSQEASVNTEEPPDEWEVARQEKEKLNRAVPPEFLAALIQKCQEVSDEVWPQVPESDTTESNWRTGFDGLENITVLLNDFVPENTTLPPLVQFSQTTTCKEMSNSLKLTKHMPLTRKSPMAHLLASKGSMEWEKSVRARKNTPADDTPVGWRILENDDRVAITEANQLKKPGGGLLSFLNRKVSSVSATDMKVESPQSPSISTRSSVERTGSPAPERRDASPARISPAAAPSSPVASSFATPDIVIPTVTPAPSAVSRFLNRFSRGKNTGSERKSLALSTDDIEFLSDIVPGAHNLDNSNDDPQLRALSNMINSSSTSISSSTSLPIKLPPPLAPPPQPPSVNASRPSSVVGLSDLRTTLEPAQGPPQPSTIRAPSLPLPLSPSRATSFSRPHSPAIPPKRSPPPVKSTFPPYSNPVIPATAPYVSPSPQPSSRAHSPFQFPPPPRAPSTLSIPPLLPPPVSSPQTPRPLSVGTSSTPTPTTSRTRPAWSTPSYDDDDDDDSFSAFSSFPRESTFPAPRESIESSLGSPSSAHALNSSKSISFDDFDDFVTSPRITTPSPPPVPAKPANVGARMAGSRPASSIHQRTQSLLELAASQRGQWPASNTHPTLPPPPIAFASFSSDVDLLGESDAVLPAQSPGPPLPRGMSALSPSPPPPPVPLVSKQPLSFAPLSPSSSRAQRAPAESGKKGGLTAQDLSFFEGL